MTVFWEVLPYLMSSPWELAGHSVQPTGNSPKHFPNCVGDYGHPQTA